MSTTGFNPGRRARAVAFTLVTTAIVLALALAEWGTERVVSSHSREASTAIEIAIVLIAALVFRPVHRKLEELTEAAFYYRKRQALASVERFRGELSSFNDKQQLLRRVIEAIDHHFETRACAVYLRRDAFRAEASSFDVPADPVALDDALAIRFQSSAAPAKPGPLRSSAPGTEAFPMTAAGNLVGFITILRRDDAFDPDEVQMLSTLAQDLAIALVALDPSLRATRDIATNIPANLPALVGREREQREIHDALSRYRLITLTGPGGVGKTRLALQCARDALERFEHGVWFVDLAPISDSDLIAGTIAAAAGVASGEANDDLARLLDHLRVRTALLVLDNCEHLIAGVTGVIARIRAVCAGVTILATSRELLHLGGEQVYRLGPLDGDSAMQLFIDRALAVSPDFDPLTNEDAIRKICDNLDGIPLAIELAAARVRALSANDILEHLAERFRLLTSGTRTALPRQRTLAATIEWSYDLLPEEEQSLFRRLGVFRGSFSLQAAAAVCGDPASCDEFHVLDLLTSLADKSLLTVSLSLNTRYRLLETIREFACQKAVELHANDVARRAHAGYFAALAGTAYHEFDSQLPEGWRERLVPDLDNFRAALSWTLESEGDRQTGAQLAADSGPLFLRMELLAEGLEWCSLARAVSPLSLETEGRIEYVASMLHNNARHYPQALECAQRAVAFLRESADQRGLVRALSQLAHQYARANQYEEAKAPAAEAIERARALNEPRILIAVLRRCAYSMPVDEIDQARTLFQEALDTARNIDDVDESCKLLQWWAGSEASAGAFDRAIQLDIEGLSCADVDTQMYIESDITGYAIASDAWDIADLHADRALQLAVAAQHPMLAALAAAYCAPLRAQINPAVAAAVFGYAMARLRALHFDGDHSEKVALLNARRRISEAIDAEELDAALESGASLTQQDVLDRLASTFRSGHSAPDGVRNRVSTLLR